MPVVTSSSPTRGARSGNAYRDACVAGGQAYWVCPLIEESEQLQLQTALDTYTTLNAELPELRVGLIHGRLKAAEKAETMAAFQAGRIQLLVGTTVIEVGVDVANASLMVIEHAERFGLAQLHQLAVGSAVAQPNRCAFCSTSILRARPPGASEGHFRERRRIRDRARRPAATGTGEYLGARQSGAPLLRFADLNEDVDLLEAARTASETLLADHPDAAERHLERWLGGRAGFLGPRGARLQWEFHDPWCPCCQADALRTPDAARQADRHAAPLWPTLWALWLASEGGPDGRIVWIFVLGTLLMRSAGCVMNDLADWRYDAEVKRTRERPLALRGEPGGGVRARRSAHPLRVCAGPTAESPYVLLSAVALALAATYPLTKRFLTIPQAYLGIAFGFGIPMGYSAVLGEVPGEAGWLLLANIFWAIAYDTNTRWWIATTTCASGSKRPPSRSGGSMWPP